MAYDDGTYPDHVEELPPDPATDSQLNYAASLGIFPPQGANKEEVSDMISVKEDRDKPASEHHKKIARGYGVSFTDYIGKKRLFDKIHEVLGTPGRESELAEWFTYRVYRELMKGASNTPITGPDDSAITMIGSQLANDPSVINSMRRYEGRDLIWFGVWTAPDGWTHTGGSNQTIAYKAAAGLLRSQAAQALKKPLEKFITPPSGSGSVSPNVELTTNTVPAPFVPAKKKTSPIGLALWGAFIFFVVLGFLE